MSEAESSSPRRPMLLVSERVEPDASIAPTTTTETTPPEAVSQYRTWRAAAMGTINVLAAVLAVRLILLVAVCGAIFLAWLAQGDAYRIAAAGVYTVTVVLPVVWLSSRR